MPVKEDPSLKMQFRTTATMISALQPFTVIRGGQSQGWDQSLSTHLCKREHSQDNVCRAPRHRLSRWFPQGGAKSVPRVLSQVFCLQRGLSTPVWCSS